MRRAKRWQPKQRTKGGNMTSLHLPRKPPLFDSVGDADMRRTRPVLTVVSGRIVYDAAGLS